MEKPYPPGYLSYADSSFITVAVCPRCGKDERKRQRKEVCDECKKSPEYIERKKKLRAKYKKNEKKKARVQELLSNGTETLLVWP